MCLTLACEINDKPQCLRITFTCVRAMDLSRRPQWAKLVPTLWSLLRLYTHYPRAHEKPKIREWLMAPEIGRAPWWWEETTRRCRIGAGERGTPTDSSISQSWGGMCPPPPPGASPMPELSLTSKSQHGMRLTRPLTQSLFCPANKAKEVQELCLINNFTTMNWYSISVTMLSKFSR